MPTVKSTTVMRCVGSNDCDVCRDHTHMHSIAKRTEKILHCFIFAAVDSHT